jgi:predicted DsbA family dithiol-disulfide isomerase
MSPLRVRLAFDVVCPWCFIGEQRFARVVAGRLDVFPIVERLPYLLHPELTTSVPRDGLLERKFGGRRAVQGMLDRLEKIGRESDIPFNFDAMEVVPNTVPAHALIKWSAAAGLGVEVIARLYGAYFCEGRDIGSVPVLTDIAHDAGLDPDDVRERLLRQDDFRAVREAAKTVRRAGITGVPCFVFDDGLVVQGAQPEGTFAKVIDRVAGPAPAPLRVAANWN